MPTPRPAWQARRGAPATVASRLERRLPPALLAASVLLAGCAGAPAGTDGTAGGDAIVAAFVDLTQAPDRSVHLDATGVVRVAGMDMRLTAAYDLYGDDYRGTSTVEAPTLGTMTVVAVMVDGVAFTSPDGTDWTGARTPAPPQDPLRGVTASDVGYAGPIDVGGSPGHRLRLRDPVGAFTRTMGVTGSEGMGAITPSDARFEVRVDGQGRPVSATVSLRGTTTAAGDIEVGIEYAFSDWDTVGPIEPPIDIPPTPDPGAVLTVYDRITADILLRDGNGVELPVPACGSASTATFDVSRFDVLLASSGDPIYMQFPSDGGFVARVVLVGADFYQTQPGAYLAELPPCRDYVTR